MVVRVESFKGAPVEGNGYGEEMPLEDMIQRAFFSKFTVGNSTSGGAGTSWHRAVADAAGPGCFLLANMSLLTWPDPWRGSHI